MPAIGRHAPNAIAAILAAAALAPTAAAQINQDNVLLLYNSRRAESQQIRDLYLAAYPNIHEFDIDTTSVGTAGVNRANYNQFIREPLRDFINGVNTGQDLSQQILVIVTTRGLPAQINGANEFAINSSWASLESELTLLQQDLEASGASVFPTRANGAVDNPYHRFTDTTITTFPRNNITVPRNFNATAAGWQIINFSAGDLYLTARLDASPTDEGTPDEITPVQNVARLIARSQNLVVPRCAVQTLFDEFAGGQQLDDDGLSPLFPGGDDYEPASTTLANAGFPTTYDDSANFITATELPSDLPLLVLATYGENHDFDGSEDPPGTAEYLDTYSFHPAAIFTSIESFNGSSIVNGNARQGQEQVLDFIARGGSFTIGHIREPFTFAVEDNHTLLENMLVHGMTFAEAAWTSIPALSWQHTPVGDPLARITIIEQGPVDRDADGALTPEDIYLQLADPADLDCDADADNDDLRLLTDLVRQSETADVTAPR